MEHYPSVFLPGQVQQNIKIFTFCDIGNKTGINIHKDNYLEYDLCCKHNAQIKTINSKYV